MRSSSYAELGNDLGKSKASIRNFLWRKGWVNKDRWWKSEHIALLKELYNSNTSGYLNLKQFGLLVGHSEANICRKAKELGLRLNPNRRHPHKPLDQLTASYRTRIIWSKLSPEEKRQRRSQNSRDYIRNHGHPRGRRVIRICPACGRFFDIEASSPNIHCSLVCGRRTRKPEITYTKGIGGKRVDLNNQYFRSSYEANYARYLNLLVSRGELLKWEYEPEMFYFPITQAVRSYTPDFKIWDKDGVISYHEVKGWDYPKGKSARKAMAKYYPHIKLMLIDETFLKTIEHNEPDIPNWEFKKRVARGRPK